MLSRKSSAEETFILELIKTTFGRGDANQLKAYFSKCKTETLNDLVRRQGLSAFFHTYLSQNRLALEIPQQLRESWKKDAGLVALQNTLIEKEGQAIFSFLHQQGINYCLLKGFVYAEEIYGSRYIRPISDLDILINKNDYPQVKAYLLQQGFRFIIMPEFGGCPEQKWIEIQEEINNEMHLCKNVGVLTIFVDLHWGTANLKTENSPLENLFKLSVDNWLQHTTTFLLGETEIKCLDPTMHFIHAVFHFAYGHQFAGVKWYLDICRLSYFMNDKINWNLVSTIVDRPGCRRLFNITRQLAAEMIGSDHQAIKNWAALDNRQIRPFDYRFFKSRLFTPKSISSKYMSYMMMPEGLLSKWRVFTYILFNREVFRLWEATGQKIHPLAQPFYILYWGIKEIIVAKRRKQ
jgi:hypothetical protein